MSHPDPSYDPDNSYDDDAGDFDMTYYNDPSYEEDIDDEWYDDDDGDFDMSYYNDPSYEEDIDDEWDDDIDDSMDGDHESGFASAGWGVDESYRDDIDAYENYYGEDY